jgi:hypothetical protein
MTAEATQPTPSDAAAVPSPTAAREKTAIPKNPGRRDLGMKATLLFPDKEIVERFYVPLIYTACRTCYSELAPDDIFERATDGRIEAAKMQKLISGVIESGHGSTIEHVVFTFGISGVSRTRSGPKASSRPSLVLNTPPAAAMSSPISSTRGSACRASCWPAWIASR